MRVVFTSLTSLIGAFLPVVAVAGGSAGVGAGMDAGEAPGLVVSVPEPVSAAILGAGVGAILLYRRFRK